jgi:hypothetical protein
MKRMKPQKKTPAKASLATPLITPHFKPRRLVSGINFHLKMAALACMAVSAGAAQAFEPVVQLSSLDGSTGFRLDGVTADDRSGRSVSAAGDVNGDGIDDLLIGAPRADPNGSKSGSSYVVFGSRASFASAIGLSSLNGSSGFRLDGVTNYDNSGYSVSAAGDVNGDGIDDLLIGAYTADPNGDESGSSYVVFGSSSGFASVIGLSSLNGSSGFRLDGVYTYDYSGYSVSAAGDVNGDGIDDLLIGAYAANPNDSNSGSSYVVFGSSSGFDSVIGLSSLNGSSGFRLDGVTTKDFSGWSVSAAGDVNGDGIDDLLIGAIMADPNGDRSGSSYVVFGSSASFASVIGLSSLNGSSGFRLDGVTAGDFSGSSVSAAGDVNGDGIDDLLIGAIYANPNDFKDAGSTYVVFGRRSSDSFASAIDLSSLNGSSGFRLDGATGGDGSGSSVSAAGDVNGDGIDDLLIGAERADPNGISSGSSYVVFGSSASFASVIGLSSLNGSSGFRLDGVSGASSGRSVSAAGDVNGDGIDDLLIGAPSSDSNGNINAGSSYVVFGAEDIAESFCVPIKTPTGGVAVICL